MIFIKLESLKNHICRSVRASKIVGVNLEGLSITIYVDDEKMPAISLAFDDFEEAEQKYKEIMEELESILV